jgi:hypothetical protein
MNITSMDSLEEHALTIADFVKLEEEEQEWLLPMLNTNIQSSIKLIRLIENKQLTYEELSLKSGLCTNTVRQKILCLKKGGFPVWADDSIAVSWTGRKRLLNRVSL